MTVGDLHCPQCDQPLPMEGNCSCGLDPSLLRAVDDAATAAANRAAHAAADGEWQKAADAASDSLRLRGDGNDLAAFLFLVARLAGARGGPDTVAAPLEEHLPAALRRFVAPVVLAVGELRAAAVPADTGDELRAKIESALEGWGGLPWRQLETRRTADRPPLEPPRRARASWVGLAVAVVAGMVIGGAALSVWGDRDRATRAGIPAATAPAVHRPGEAESTRRIDELTAELESSRSESAQNAARAEVLGALLESDWDRVTALLATSPSFGVEEIAERLDIRTARSTYLAGLAASRASRYAEAAVLLDLAATAVKPTVYFWDDAVYYLARAYQRSGQGDRAAATFQSLLREAPGSLYAPEARRQLAVLGDARTVTDPGETDAR